MHTLDWINMDALLGYTARTAEAPQRSRFALAQAFVAKAVLGLEQTTQLRSRLAVDTVLARLLGFESNRPLPSEATFSRAFAEFARTGLPAKAHEALIRQHLGQVVIGHIARDSIAIHARERTQYSQAETAALNAAKAAKQAKMDKTAKQPKRHGRPPAGSADADKASKAKPHSQSESSLRTTLLYTDVTARAVHEALVQKGWSAQSLPSVRAISNPLNRQNYRLRTVAKTRVQKKHPRSTPSLPTSGG